MSLDRISADVPAIVAHLKEGTPIEGEQNKRALKLAKFLSSLPASDLAPSLEERSIKILEEDLHHVVKIFSNENPIKALEQNSEELPRLFRIAVKEGTATKDEVTHIFENLIHLAGSKELGEGEVIAKILQDTEEAIEKGVLDDEFAYFSIGEEGKESPINAVALCAKSEGFYQLITETRMGGEPMEALALPKNFGEMLKEYVEEDKLPAISRLNVRALAHAYTFLEGNRFPDALTDHFLDHLIVGLEKEQTEGLILPEAVEFFNRLIEWVDHDKKSAHTALKDMMSMVRKLPEKKRVQILNAALPTLVGKKERNEKIALVQITLLFPKKKDVPKKFAQLFDRISNKNAKELEAFVEQLRSTPEKIREEVVRQFFRVLDSHRGQITSQNAKQLLANLHLMLSSSDEYALEALQESFDNIGEDGVLLVDVVLDATPLIQNLNNGFNFSLDNIADIEREERRAVIQAVLPLLPYVRDDMVLSSVLCAVQEIAPASRDRVVATALRLSENTESRDLSSLINIVDNVSEEVIEEAEPLLTSARSGQEKATILTIVDGLYSEERNAIIEAALPYLADAEDGYLIASFISAIDEIPEDRREEAVLNPLFSLLQRHGDLNRTHVLIWIEKTPEEERADLIRLATPLLDTVDAPGQLYRYMPRISKINPRMREAAITAALQRQTFEERFETLGAYYDVE